MKVTDIAHTLEDVINQFVSPIFIFESYQRFTLKTDNKPKKRNINSLQGLILPKSFGLSVSFKRLMRQI